MARPLLMVIIIIMVTISIRPYSLRKITLAGLILFCLALGRSVTSAQNYRGEAVPVVERVDPVEFSRLRFLTFAFGREGPMDAPLPTPPVAGREYFVEADVFVGHHRLNFEPAIGRYDRQRIPHLGRAPLDIIIRI